MDILALSAPQLVAVNEYPVRPYRTRQQAAYDRRGTEPDTVWVQVIVLDATQIRRQQNVSLQESRTSTRPAFPGTWGLFSLGEEQMRNAWGEDLERRTNTADDESVYPTLFCREELTANTAHAAEYWKREGDREVVNNEIPDEPRFTQEYLHVDLDIIECLKSLYGTGLNQST